MLHITSLVCLGHAGMQARGHAVPLLPHRVVARRIHLQVQDCQTLEILWCSGIVLEECPPPRPWSEILKAPSGKHRLEPGWISEERLLGC